MEEDLKEICRNCQAEQPPGFRFCSKCGEKNHTIKKELKGREESFQKNLKYLAAYTFTVIAALLVNLFFDETFELIVAFSILFASVALVFAFLQPETFTLLKKSIQPGPALMVVLMFVTSGCVVTLFGDFMNETFYGERFSYSTSFLDTDYPLVYSLIFVAVFPAVFEELAFRGFVYNNIEVVSGTKSAIWGSSFLFALIHFSMISLLWLIPFALLLTFLRRKYGTIVYGMLGHFCHNATVVFIDYYFLF